MKYKKKPIVVEAFQYDGDMIYSSGDPYAPAWALQAIEDGAMYYKDAGDLYIKTPEGDHHIPVGDYINKDASGALYPCKPGIFRQTYDPVPKPVDGPNGCGPGPVGKNGPISACPQCGGTNIRYESISDTSSCTGCGWHNWASVLENREIPDEKKGNCDMKNYDIIEVTFSNGHSAVWEASKGEWDDYAYDGKAFIIKKDGAWVGIYNMNHVISVVVK